MWRHAVLECLQVALERGRIHAPLGQHRQIVAVAMQSLPTRYELQSAEQQVEAARVARPIGVGVGIERALGSWVTPHEQEIRAMLLTCPLAQPALMRRRKVGLAAHILAGRPRKKIERVGEVQRWDTMWHI